MRRSEIKLLNDIIKELNEKTRDEIIVDYNIINGMVIKIIIQDSIKNSTESFAFTKNHIYDKRKLSDCLLRLINK